MEYTQLLGAGVLSGLRSAHIQGRTVGPFTAQSAISILDSDPDKVEIADGVGDDQYMGTFRAYPQEKPRPSYFVSLFLQICDDYTIPDLFVQMLVDAKGRLLRGGSGCFTTDNDNEQPRQFRMFHLLHMSRRSRCMIYTVHNYSSDTILHVCALEMHHLNSWIDQVAMLRADPGRRSPLGLHIYLLQLAYEGSHADIWGVRGHLIEYETGQDQHTIDAQGRRERISSLHDLAQENHIAAENLANVEQSLGFMQSSLEKLAHSKLPVSEQAIDIDTQLLEHLQSKCQHTRRWIVNYRDRTNIQINLAFHLSQQLDNEINAELARTQAELAKSQAELSESTAQLAEYSYRDGSAMITIAVVTLFFLPGTFISAFFSMVFFDSSSDSNGAGGIHVSKEIWWYVAVTVPATAIVFAIWTVWRKDRTKKYLQSLRHSKSGPGSKHS